jgi:salicylate hydroxylase
MKKVVFKKFDDGTVLDQRIYLNVENELGAPIWQIHRADLHDVLLAKALDTGVTIKMNAKVTHYDWAAPSAALEDGSIIKADVIIAADGSSNSNLFCRYNRF